MITEHFKPQFRLDVQTETEAKEFRKHLDELRNKTLDTIDKQKESVILQASGMTNREARQQMERFQMVFTPDGIQHVFLDGQPLVEFMPGYMQAGHWHTPYRLHPRNSTTEQPA